MLRVLQVIPTLDRAGAEKQVVLLSAGLPRDRFEVGVAALTRLGPYEAELRAAGVPVTLFSKRLKLDAPALARLARFMKRGRFDVVNTWIFAANVYGRIAARMARVPVVITSEMAADLWKGKAELRIDRWLAGWTHRVVGNSAAVVEFYASKGIPRDKLALIYSGVPLDHACAEASRTRTELGIPGDAIVFLFAGRLAEQKRVADLIDALDLLQHVEPGVVTLIAGDGPLRAELEERARNAELLSNGRVRFLGARDDAARLIDAADAVVLPSRYEGLPNIVLEAMAQRKPVVATDAPGTNEVVVHEETGLLVPIGQPRELCRALRAVARDPGLRARLGEAGRIRASERFEVGRMIEAYASLYERLAGGRESAT